MADIIRRVIVEGKSTGLKQVQTDLEGVTDATVDLGEASKQTATAVETSTRREISAGQALRSLRLSLDETFRAQDKFAKGVKVLDSNLKELGVAEHARLMGLLKARYEEAATAATKLAAAQRTFTSTTMAGTVAAKGGITQRTMTPSSSLEAATSTAAAAERQFQSMTIAGSAAAAGGITQRTMAVNQLGAATETAATAERQFQAMTIAGSASVVGSITQRTMAVNQLTAATNTAVAAQRQFTAMTIAGAPGPQGRITGSTTGFQPRAPADIEKTAAGLPKAAADMTKLGQSTKLTAFEVTNLGMQFNDIAVMASSGQNPMVLIMQQGMQLAQIMAMSSVATEGLKGTLQALGGAVVTFLTNPFYLAVAAAAALAGGIMLLWDSFESGAPDAEESLKRHEALLDRVTEAYGKATVEAIRLHEAQTGALLAFQAQTNVLEAQGQVAAALATTISAIKEKWGDLNLDMLIIQVRELQALQTIGGLAPEDAARLDETAKEANMFVRLAAMVEEFNKDAADGVIITEQWTEKFVALGETAPADVRAAVVAILDLIEVLDQANKRLLEATRLRTHLQRVRAGEYIDPFAPTARQAEQAGMQALNKQLGIDPDKGIADRLEAEARAQEDYAKATQTAIDAAARESETVAELIDQLRFEQAIMHLNAEEKAVANAIRQAGAAATAAEREQIDQLTRSLFRQAEAEKAAEEAARKAKQAAEEEARRRKQAADAAAREAERKQDFIEQLRFEHEIMDMLEEDQAVANNLRKLGADATAAQKEEVEALTRSMEQYKVAVKAAEEADKAAMKAWEDARDKAIEKMDEFRDSAKGILSAFIEGGPQGAMEAIASRLATLGEDLVISGLFGEQGAAGGGLFGDAIQNLLAPIGEKPVATMNVQAGVVNIGGGYPGAGAATGSFRAAQEAGMSSAASAVDLASAQMGAHEVTSGEQVDAFLKAGGIDIDAARTAWCAAFVNSSLAQVGIKGTGSVVATSFGAWGEAVKPENIMKGDVLVQMRGLSVGATGGHVGFATGETRMTDAGVLQAQMLAGNQSDKVGTSWVDAQSLSIRRATEAMGSTPLATAATASTTAVDSLNSSLNVLENSVNQVVPGMGSLTMSVKDLLGILGLGGGGISTQASAAISGGFGGLFQHGGTLGAGNWGIAGEHGPEIIHGPANVTPMQRGVGSKFNVNIKTQEGVTARVTNAQQNEEGDFDLEIFAEALEHRVRDKYGLRQQVSRWGRA